MAQTSHPGMVISQNDLAALRHLHRLATDRYEKLIDTVYTREQDEVQAYQLHNELRQQRAFIVELNRLLYEAGVEQVPR